jgi:RNA polymerase-binding transcription factor DksA
MTLTTLERHADNADSAADLAQLEIDLAIEATKNHSDEKPAYNKNGLRICLDCESFIPIERIRSTNAVRCVYCQTDLEKYRQFYKRTFK